MFDFETSLEAVADSKRPERIHEDQIARNVRRFADFFFTCTEVTSPYPLHKFVKSKHTEQIGMAFCVRANTPDGWLTAVAYEDHVDLLDTNMIMLYKGGSTPQRLGALFGTLVATDSTFKLPKCSCCGNRGGKATTSH